jgi:hypothetical protein
MFGLEKEKKRKPFEYDLELEIKEKPQKGQEIIAKAQAKAQEIKNSLRDGGATGKEFDQLGDVLHAYAALETVIKRAIKT